MKHRNPFSSHNLRGVSAWHHRRWWQPGEGVGGAAWVSGWSAVEEQKLETEIPAASGESGVIC